MFAQLINAGQLAIKEDGANVLVLSATAMYRPHTYLDKNLSVPVLNQSVIACTQWVVAQPWPAPKQGGLSQPRTHQGRGLPRRPLWGGVPS